MVSMKYCCFIEVLKASLPAARLSNRIYRVNFLLSLLLVLFTSSTGCHSKDRESYKNEIEKKGIVYSEESFLNEIILANGEVIDLFLKSGIDINAKTPDGQTALMLALSRGNLDLFKVLADNGADINVSDNEGNTALMLAAFNGHNKAVRILIKKRANVHAVNKQGYTAFMFASFKGNKEIADLLKKTAAKQPQ